MNTIALPLVAAQERRHSPAFRNRGLSFVATLSRCIPAVMLVVTTLMVTSINMVVVRPELLWKYETFTSLTDGREYLVTGFQLVLAFVGVASLNQVVKSFVGHRRPGVVVSAGALISLGGPLAFVALTSPIWFLGLPLLTTAMATAVVTLGQTWHKHQVSYLVVSALVVVVTGGYIADAVMTAWRVANLGIH